jgi:hypothetical protein
LQWHVGATNLGFMYFSLSCIIGLVVDCRSYRREAHALSFFFEIKLVPLLDFAP